MTELLLPDAGQLDVEQLVERLRAPIENARDEAETARRLLVEELYASGVFDLLTPRALGGVQASLTTGQEAPAWCLDGGGWRLHGRHVRVRRRGPGYEELRPRLRS